MSINRVNITGNLTRDPELRATAGGTQVLSFGVAVTRRLASGRTIPTLSTALCSAPAPRP